MVPEVEDSVAIGLRVNGDVEVVLFVALVPDPSAQEGKGGKRGGGAGGGRGPPQNVSDVSHMFCERQSHFTEYGTWLVTTLSLLGIGRAP